MYNKLSDIDFFILYLVLATSKLDEMDNSMNPQKMKENNIMLNI